MRQRAMGVMMCAAAWAALAGGQALGQGSAGQGKAAKPSGAKGVSAAPAVPEVELLERGAEPRRALRYAFDGGVQWATMYSEATQTMTVNGNTMPTPSSPAPGMLVRAESAASAGKSMAVSVVILPLSAGEGGLGDEEIEGMIASGAASRIEGVIDDRGFWASLEVEESASVPAEMRGMLDARRNSLEHAVLALPEGPVGVGGSWRVERDVDINGMTMRQTTVCTVASMDGDVVALDVERTMVFGPQDVRLPMLPEGATMKITGGEGSAAGTETIDLRKVLAVRSRVEGMFAIRMDMEMGGLGAQMIQQSVKATTTIEPWEPGGN